MIQYTMVIADDEEIERKALRLLVQKEFPEIEIVALVSNGTDLVEQAQKWRPDIAIVDVNMPGINGIDAIDLLCARGYIPDTLSIQLMTSLSMFSGPWHSRSTPIFSNRKSGM